MVVKKGEGSDSATKYDIARECKQLMECLTTLYVLGRATSQGAMAYRAGQAIMEMCASLDDYTGRRFYAFPGLDDKLGAIGSLVSALGNGENSALNVKVLDALEEIQHDIYNAMVNYLNDCDAGGTK